MPSAKPDCACALPEKSQHSDRIHCRAGRSLQSGLSVNNCEIRGTFRVFRGEGPRNYSAVKNCMAEGEGFEPPVRFPAQRFSRPPVSTTHTSLRERVKG